MGQKNSMLQMMGFLLGSVLFFAPPMWTVNPAAYQYNMNGTIRVVTQNNTFLNESGTMIRVVVNGETRGVVDSTDIITVDGEAYFPITIHSNQQVGEAMSFEVYVSSTDSIYQASETAFFNRNETLGSPANPFILTIGICQDVLVLTQDDVPFRPFYKAGQEIRLQGISHNQADTITLDAPLVYLNGLTSLNNESLINVLPNGCIE